MNIDDIRAKNAYYERLTNEVKMEQKPKVNIDELVFRASAMSKLMGLKGLGETGKKAARHNYLESKYGRYKKITSKYMSKGIAVEAIGIEMLSQYLEVDLTKNEERKYNELFTGECDIDTGEIIIDHKASWDIFTHDDAIRVEESDYKHQMHVYMQLWGRKQAKVSHVLIDAPDEEVLRALEIESYKYPDRETPECIEVDILKDMIYSRDNFERFVNIRGLGGDEITDRLIETFIEIPFEERFNIVDVPYSAPHMQIMESRVKEAREYLKTIYK